ncbi:hypothetical protein Vca1114GL_01736 [Vibrio campbellii]|uniref:hypothetical protein n=1 Tax=Vibrio campbellii TaxID=680 RepID=UPI00097FAC3F|nr:hypothetical protein [Vibrio campbellii]AQM68237.1 hypothetical protein Vca1114GL_01736 [Vibrio campbellii]
MSKELLDRSLALFGSIIFFFNLPPFFLWELGVFGYWLLLAVFFILGLYRCERINHNDLIIISLFIMIYFLNSVSSFGIFRPNLLTLLSVSVFCILPPRTKEFVFRGIILTYVLINIISIPCYILTILGVDLPTTIIEPANEYKNGYYINHLFSLSYSDTVVNGFHRYQSVFDEPGVIGSLSMLIIAMTHGKVNFKFSRIIALVSGVISFSFAFYILMIVYLLFRTLSENRYLLKVLIVVPILILILMPHYESLKQEIPMVDKMEYRFGLLIDGSEKVSNRTSGVFEKSYSSFFNSVDVILGRGEGAASKVDPTGNSFKYYIYDNGLVSFFLVNIIIIYYSLLKNPDKWNGLLVFIIASLFLLQRSNYVSLWFLMLLIGFSSNSESLLKNSGNNQK